MSCAIFRHDLKEFEVLTEYLEAFFDQIKIDDLDNNGHWHKVSVNLYNVHDIIDHLNNGEYGNANIIAKEVIEEFIYDAFYAIN